MSQDRAPSLPSGRPTIDVAASLPLSAATPPHACEGLSALCTEWLALDLEIDRLSLRWSSLELQAAREFDWFKLSTVNRRALPMAAEMADIDARLEQLFKDRAKGLKALRRTKATDGHGAFGELVVAARISQQDGGDVHALLAEAVEILATLTCPTCGAPFAPAPSRSS